MPDAPTEIKPNPIDPIQPPDAPAAPPAPSVSTPAATTPKADVAPPAAPSATTTAPSTVPAPEPTAELDPEQLIRWTGSDGSTKHMTVQQMVDVVDGQSAAVDPEKLKRVDLFERALKNDPEALKQILSDYLPAEPASPGTPGTPPVPIDCIS